MSRTGYIVDAVRSSRILIGKQKLGVTFNSDKLGGIDFTKFSKTVSYEVNLASQRLHIEVILLSKFSLKAFERGDFN
jgi:hypothetical protein